MAISLYDATIPSCLQLLAAVSNLLDKAQAFCAEKGLDPNSLLQARLADDMQPFVYQVKSTRVHSVGAIEGVRRGSFSPDTSTPPQTFPDLKIQVAETIEALKAVEPSEIESFIGRDLRFVFGERQVPYTAENFLLSFSQPNFYFHATTTYDILRWKGVPIGKRDFIGRPRFKQ
jgi:uncharacterized protein